MKYTRICTIPNIIITGQFVFAAPTVVFIIIDTNKLPPQNAVTSNIFSNAMKSPDITEGTTNNNGAQNTNIKSRGSVTDANAAVTINGIIAALTFFLLCLCAV